MGRARANRAGGVAQGAGLRGEVWLPCIGLTRAAPLRDQRDGHDVSHWHGR